MKTFDDLVFKEHPHNCLYKLLGNFENAHRKRAILNLDNEYGISVVLGKPSYSNGVDTYEVAILRNGKICNDTPIAKDIIGFQTKEQINEIIERLMMY